MSGRRTTGLVRIIALLSMGMAPASGCNGGGAQDSAGSLRASLQATSGHDVAAIRYTVVTAGEPCTSPPLAQTNVTLQPDSLPPSIQPDGGGSGNNHAFADAFFTLAPGDYQVCVQPLKQSGDPSDECQPASANATVVAGQTTEIMIVSQCRGEPTGGIDGVTILNDPPRIDAVDFVPSKFIDVCDVATISVTASDPDGDAISYAWQLVSVPPGADVTLAPSGATATFTANLAADYQVQVTVTDVYGGSTSLIVPIHVSGDSDVPQVCFTLTVEARGLGTVTSDAPPGGINCNDFSGSPGPDCAQAYPSNTSVTLAAVVPPEALGDISFGGWLPPCPGGLNVTTTVTMDQDRTCVALFNPIYRVSILGQGTVDIEPFGQTCTPDILCERIVPVDQDFTMTATPAPGFAFAGWQGAACGGVISISGNTATVRVHAPDSCSVTFIAQ